uniref:Uncharacterized protein n=1 Tax=Arundo donax TaxID=35708 RepID=A0A0A9AKQ9_ARUDO
MKPEVMIREGWSKAKLLQIFVTSQVAHHAELNY